MVFQMPISGDILLGFVAQSLLNQEAGRVLTAEQAHLLRLSSSGLFFTSMCGILLSHVQHHRCFLCWSYWGNCMSRLCGEKHTFNTRAWWLRCVMQNQNDTVASSSYYIFHWDSYGPKGCLPQSVIGLSIGTSEWLVLLHCLQQADLCCCKPLLL